MDQVVYVRSSQIEALRDRGDAPLLRCQLSAQQLALVVPRRFMKCRLLRDRYCILEMPSLDLRRRLGVRTDQCAFDGMAQLPDVASPRASLQLGVQATRRRQRRDPVV